MLVSKFMMKMKAEKALLTNKKAILIGVDLGTYFTSLSITDNFLK